MPLPSADAAWFQEVLEPLLADVIEAFQAQGHSPDDEVTPPLLVEAFSQLVQVMARVESDRRAGGDGAGPLPGLAPKDVTELGEYVLGLLHDLGVWMDRLGLARRRAELAALAAGAGLWTARQGGELAMLEPVVDALAQLANTTTEPAELEALSGLMGEIIAAVTPAIKHDLEHNNPGRPWRVLNLNRGIVATRSHQPEVMEDAFHTLVQNLPEDAPQFFAEGMQQMDIVGYPPHVRQVMEKYYRQWSARPPLH